MPTTALILAHPLTEPAGFGLPPAFVGGVAALAVILASRWPAGARPAGGDGRRRWGSWVSAILVIGCIVLARTGPVTEVRNPVSSLVLGLLWPLLLLAMALGLPAWRRLSPWPPLARGLERLGGSTRPASASASGWWAVPAAVGIGWYLSAHLTPLAPRSLGLALAVLGVGLMAGSLADGAHRWLRQGDAVHVLGEHARSLRQPTAMAATRGQQVAIGLLLGSMAFAVLRVSRLWLTLLPLLGAGPADLPARLIGWAVSAVIGVALVVVLERWATAEGGRTGVVTAQAAALACTLGVVHGLVFERLLKAAVFTAGHLSDPLAQGWDLLGTAGLRPPSEILGADLALAVQLVVLVLLGGQATRHAVRSPGRAARQARALAGVTIAVTAAALSAV